MRDDLGRSRQKTAPDRDYRGSTAEAISPLSLPLAD
jgi:hypothetical protein